MFLGLKKFCIFESFLLPIYFYVLIKSLLPIDDKTPPLKKTTLLIIRPLITLACMAIFLISLLVFCLVHDTLYIFLKFRHGKNFSGMVPGCNAVFSYEKCVINSIQLVETQDPNDVEKLVRFYHNMFPLILRNHDILRCTIEPIMGYHYYKRSPIKWLEAIRTIDGYHDYESFQERLQEICGEMLPHEGKAMWALSVGKKIIRWENGTSGLPIVLRYNHALGDGMALVILTAVSFYKDGLEVMREKMDKIKAMLDNHKKKTEKKQDLMTKLTNIFTKDYFMQHKAGFDPVSVLHPKKLSGQKYITWSNEQENDNIKEQIREIRTKIGVGYTDVVLGACTATLREYFKKNEKIRLPECITIWLPYYLSSVDFNKMVQLDDDNLPIVTLGNKFVMLQLKLPINKQEIGDDVIKMMNFINKQTETLKTSMDIFVNYWLTYAVAGIFPAVFGHSLLNYLYDATAIISNLPGNPEVTFKCGNRLADVIFCTTNYLDTGVSILLCGYKEKMRIGAMFDKACVKNRAEAQALTDNILKNISQIYNEVV